MNVGAKAAAAALAAAVAGVPVGLASAKTAPKPRAEQHVLLISVDGMHQSDLVWYVHHHPSSELAKLTRAARQYTNAQTANPSDSDPGGTAIMTGADPGTSGVYYDVEYSHATDEAGAKCTPGKAATGGDVIFDSPDDKLNSVPDLLNNGSAGSSFPSFDEGGSLYPKGVDKDPAKIMDLTPRPQSGLNPGSYPVDPRTCKPISPWDYLQTNTIFQVIHAAHKRTAWSDKHAVYTSFNGPGSGGSSIDDFFGPEIDSQAVEPNGVPYPQDDDWAHIEAATKQYDGYKVQALVNEIDGYQHSGQGKKVGTPAIYGMNFQVVSVAEKVDSPGTITKNADGSYTVGPKQLAGYYPGGTKPRALLAGAFDYVNQSLVKLVNALRAKQELNDTAIIITAKHGQSPQDPTLLKRIDDGPIITAINAAWAQTHPSNTKLIVAGTDDDLWQSYLSDRSQAAADFVKNYLWSHSATATLYSNDGKDRGTKQVAHSGLAQIWAGADAARFFGVKASDPRHPDVFGKVQVGVVYMGPKGKIAEHGGMNTQDRHVLLTVWAPGIVKAGTSAGTVGTKQVAPTVLQLLGLDPAKLDAVKRAGTKVLPGIN